MIVIVDRLYIVDIFTLIMDIFRQDNVYLRLTIKLYL